MWLFFKEINALLSGQLTEEDEEAVEEELAAILSEKLPEIPKQEPEIIITEHIEEPSPEQGMFLGDLSVKICN